MKTEKSQSEKMDCCDRCIVIGEAKEGVVLQRDDGKIMLMPEVSQRLEPTASESEAKEEIKRLALIVESSDDAVISETLDGRILTWNGGSEKMYGYSPEEVVGKSVSILFPPGRGDELPLILESIKRGERISHYETVRVRKDGQQIYVSLTVSPLFDAKGGMIGASSIDRDITHLKETEEKLQRLALIVESSDDAIISKTLDGTIRTWNAGAERMYGYSAEEAVGRNVSLLLPPGNADELPQIMEILGRGVHISHYETVRLRKNGQPIDVSLSVSPMVDAEGWIVGASVIARDITDRKRAEEERRHLEQQIEQAQKLEGLGLLAGGIAHDFNNLLVGIMGNTDLALSESTASETTKTILADVQKAALQAVDLCRQLLAYSGKGKFVLQALDLSELAGEMGRLLEVAISKKATLKYSLARGLPAVEADSSQVRQVIMNLITNASEALNDEAGTISVSTGVMNCVPEYLSQALLGSDLREGAYVYIEVGDTGGGMNAETISKIFDPFYTTKRAGRGLGLAAVLGIVRSHKGCLRVESRPGEGAVFRVLLPTLGRPAEALVPEPTVEEDWRGSGTVLVVDDEETVRRVSRRILEKVGFSVLEAPDGVAALEIFKQECDQISCVLMDLSMPHMDGVETLQRMRELKHDVPVLLSSGYDEQDLVARFTSSGLTGFVQKPYRIGTLVSKVKSAVEKPDAKQPVKAGN